MRQHPAFLEYIEKYKDIDKEPLVIEAYLSSNISNYDPIMFDNVLAYCVVLEALQGKQLEDSQEPYNIPIPVEVVWRNKRDLPLYAASSFLPVGISAASQMYLHKRMQTGLFSYAKSGTLRLESIKGQFMERQVRVPVLACYAMQAFCIGNKAEITRLLKYVTHLGKRRNSGLGSVKYWEVSSVPELMLNDVFIQNNKLTRNFPIAASHILGSQPYGSVGLASFTPPYWLPGIQEPCYLYNSSCEG